VEVVIHGPAIPTRGSAKNFAQCGSPVRLSLDVRIAEHDYLTSGVRRSERPGE
jgi:hypothetical protein